MKINMWIEYVKRFIYEVFPPDEQQPRVVMQVANEAWMHPEMVELAEILHLVI